MRPGPWSFLARHHPPLLKTPPTIPRSIGGQPLLFHKRSKAKGASPKIASVRVIDAGRSPFPVRWLSLDRAFTIALPPKVKTVRGSARPGLALCVRTASGRGCRARLGPSLSAPTLAVSVAGPRPHLS